MSSPRPLFGILLAGLLVSACGGGGGGGGGGGDEAAAENTTEVRAPEPPPTEQPPASEPEVMDDGRIALTSGNAQYVVDTFEFFTSLLQANFESSLLSSKAKTGSVSTMSGITIGKGWDWPTDEIAHEEEGFPELPEDTTSDCDTSGSVTLSHVEDSEGQTSFRTFNGCLSAGLKIDGKTTYRFEDFREETRKFGYLEVTIEGFHLDYGLNYNLVLDGTLSFRVTPDGTEKILIYNGSMHDNLNEVTHTAKDLVIRMPRNSEFGLVLGYRYIVSGEFHDSELGYVTLGNEPALRTVVMTGKEQSKVRLSILDGERLIAVDADGDAGYESYIR